MSSPSEKLAGSLEVLKILQDQGITAIQAKNLTRTHRERLLKHGFLQEIIKPKFGDAINRLIQHQLFEKR